MSHTQEGYSKSAPCVASQFTGTERSYLDSG